MIFLKSPDAVGADFGLEANMHNEESEREKERAREKERETALQYTGRYVCVSESIRVEFLSPSSIVSVIVYLAIKSVVSIDTSVEKLINKSVVLWCNN